MNHKNTVGPVPRWVQVVTVAAVSVVAAVAAVASYVHMHQLADEAGEEWRAHLIPLSVDGLLVAASMVMLVRRRANLPAGVLPWFGLILGIGASLAANVAAARPDPLSWVVSGWPPVALAISFELLILVTRDTTMSAQGEPEVAEMAGDESPDPDRHEVALEVDPVAELIAAGVGRRRLSRELGVSEYEARQLLAARTNGHLVEGGDQS
jgi:hypothetical protein